ncbi:MAG: ExbD/TolR family protein [Pirellulaceae bacterium]
MPLKTHQDEEPTLNMTPMIDVVFLLIIFFMAGTKFSEWESKLTLKVPQVRQMGTLAPAPEKRVVNVYRDGRISLDRDFMSIAELTRRLTAVKQEYSGVGVLVRGDAEGSFQHVASVLGACRDAGITDMGISVRVAQLSDGSQSR